jgi:hypothetical protein
MKKQQEMFGDVQKSVKPLLEQMVGSVANALGLLIPVYVFLMPFYKSLLLNFVYNLRDRRTPKSLPSRCHTFQVHFHSTNSFRRLIRPFPNQDSILKTEQRPNTANQLTTTNTQLLNTED